MCNYSFWKNYRFSFWTCQNDLFFLICLLIVGFSISTFRWSSFRLRKGLCWDHACLAFSQFPLLWNNNLIFRCLFIWHRSCLCWWGLHEIVWKPYSHLLSRRSWRGLLFIFYHIFDPFTLIYYSLSWRITPNLFVKVSLSFHRFCWFLNNCSTDGIVELIHLFLIIILPFLPLICCVLIRNQSSMSFCVGRDNLTTLNRFHSFLRYNFLVFFTVW